MTELDEEIVTEFLVESHENLDQLDRDLVDLEKDPRDRAILARIFRTIHTIKGTSGFLALGKLESVTHVGESLLSLLRDGALVVDPEITTALLKLVDAVRSMLTSIESARTEGDGDYSELVATLTRLKDGGARAAQENVAAAQAVPATAPESVPIAAPEPSTATAAPAAPSEAPRAVPPVAAAPSSAGAPAHDPPAPESARLGSVSDNSIRVDVALLDKLMNLVGELVLARNQVIQFTGNQEDAGLHASTQRLNLITTELQESVMKTRMQPIGNVWSKFPRVVRDLALSCGKQVGIEMEGQETEIDKTIIEAIKDPLTHVVRNSVDHGIEAPERRVATGKSAQGRIVLRAFHEGGQVNIEIIDDGAGIDPERIRAKAISRGIVTPEQAARLGEREILNLVFLPGFSTAEKVTNVSGRGVGMDVVRTNIEKIGGTVDIQSRVGEGTTMRIKIPLTLAIIPALIVTACGDRYAIPQVSLVELVRLDGVKAKQSIETVRGAPVYRLRGNLLPLVYLARELELEQVGSAAPTADSEVRPVNIVVLQADEHTFGLVVDGISDTEEIVVKPLGKQLKGVECFAGATIMGDGAVALILDVLGIAQRSGVVSGTRDRALAEKEVTADSRLAEAQSLLLVGVGENGRLAVPLSTVARLEEFGASTVERADGREVVQYRGEILPLIRVADALGFAALETDPLQVVVYSEQGKSVGLVVDRILDIVEERITTQRSAHRPGLLGSAVIQGHVTDLLNIQGAIAAVDPELFAQAPLAA